jgi:hypothetical protein
MLGSIVITVPALFYLLKSGPSETLHELKPHRSITNEIETHEQEKGIQDSRKSEKPSERDPVRKVALCPSSLSILTDFVWITAKGNQTTN